MYSISLINKFTSVWYKGSYSYLLKVNYFCGLAIYLFLLIPEIIGKVHYDTIAFIYGIHGKAIKTLR